MGRIETALIRHYLKPTVTSDLPGRLRLSFKGYQMLPKEALPYLHYVQDVMTMLPGVQLIAPRVSMLCVSSSVCAPMRAAASAASVPAWPPPTTMTSNSWG